MVEKFVCISIQSRKRLLRIEIVIRLLGCFVQGRIASAVGAPEGGVRVIRQAIKTATK